MTHRRQSNVRSIKIEQQIQVGLVTCPFRALVRIKKPVEKRKSKWSKKSFVEKGNRKTVGQIEPVARSPIKSLELIEKRRHSMKVRGLAVNLSHDCAEARDREERAQRHSEIDSTFMKTACFFQWQSAALGREHYWTIKYKIKKKEHNRRIFQK